MVERPRCARVGIGLVPDIRLLMNQFAAGRRRMGVIDGCRPQSAGRALPRICPIFQPQCL
jgi:hypothetical protein